MGLERRERTAAGGGEETGGGGVDGRAGTSMGYGKEVRARWGGTTGAERWMNDEMGAGRPTLNAKTVSESSLLGWVSAM